MSDFVHLHLHTQYSLLDGAIRLTDLIQTSLDHGQKMVAVTDHGSMYGTLDFYKKARKAALKPILGCEAYMAGSRGRQDRSLRESYHLILLAKNLEGYQNLSYLVSMGYLEGFYYNPRIDKELLSKHSAGLIATSACLGGEVAQHFFIDGPDKARETALLYKNIFPARHFFLEIQDNGMAEQERYNDFLKELSGDIDVPLVATNDCHYLRKEDARAHHILMCIQWGNTSEEAQSTGQGCKTDAFYLKSPEEMWAAKPFADCPQALHHTVEIAEQCQVELPLGQHYLPNFQVPESLTKESYLSEVANKGLEDRYKEFRYPVDRQKYQDRLEYELKVIQDMGFAGYFLIVWDFISYAKKEGIPVGPGRGSGAGSLVAYALGITNLDPILYDLIFERFLNPERVSMPDFDIDFCQDRRAEVIQYVTKTYGQNNVAQIATFGELSAKSVIKDVGRVLGLPFNEVNEVTKLIPNMVNGRKVKLAQALQVEPKLRKLQKDNPRYGEIIEVGQALEGLFRQAGIHAAGVVIGDKPLWEYVPLWRNKEGDLVSQFAKNEVEEAGLVKFDFLGLKTLTHIATAVKLTNQSRALQDLEPLDIDTIPLDEAAVYKLIAAGETNGVFQLESSGFKELLRRLRPDNFEDIIAAVALYRPGPLDAGMVDDYIERKHGRKTVTYPHPVTEEILKPTYGVIVYQEQVMRIAVTLCGFTMGGADKLRKAMGKKLASAMAEMRTKFVDGAVETSGMDRQAAQVFFDQIEKFAGYAFNKSHSAAYAMISYQTAYLKTHHPVEFMAALLSTEMHNTDNVVKYISEARESGVAVLPPCVNQSERGFTVRNGKIRFGLGAVKGVGDASIEAILNARAEEGAFTNLFQFCEFVDRNRVNKKTVEALVKAGAFDFSDRDRATLMASIDRAVDRGFGIQRDRDSGQGSLFDLITPDKSTAAQSVDFSSFYVASEPWTDKLRLASEKEVLGFYLTGHPLDRYRPLLAKMGTSTTPQVDKKANRAEVRLAGVVSAIKEKTKKNGGGRWAIVNLEDLEGSVEVFVFARQYETFESLLKSDNPVFVRGNIMERDEERPETKVQAEEVLLLQDMKAAQISSVDIRVSVAQVEAAKLDLLEKILASYKGDCQARLMIREEDAFEAIVCLPDGYKVSPEDELVDQIERLLGSGSVALN